MLKFDIVLIKAQFKIILEKEFIAFELGFTFGGLYIHYCLFCTLLLHGEEEEVRIVLYVLNRQFAWSETIKRHRKCFKTIYILIRRANFADINRSRISRRSIKVVYVLLLTFFLRHFILFLLLINSSCVRWLWHHSNQRVNVNVLSTLPTRTIQKRVIT